MRNRKGNKPWKRQTSNRKRHSENNQYQRSYRESKQACSCTTNFTRLHFTPPTPSIPLHRLSPCRQHQRIEVSKKKLPLAARTIAAQRWHSVEQRTVEERKRSQKQRTRKQTDDQLYNRCASIVVLCTCASCLECTHAFNPINVQIEQIRKCGSSSQLYYHHRKKQHAKQPNKRRKSKRNKDQLNESSKMTRVKATGNDSAPSMQQLSQHSDLLAHILMFLFTIDIVRFCSISSWMYSRSCSLRVWRCQFYSSVISTRCYNYKLLSLPAHEIEAICQYCSSQTCCSTLR